jgi:5-hydroxyisourate hydrolase
MGKLTTHILDTASGKPAGGVVIELFRLSPSLSSTRLASVVSNSDGRCDSPLLEGDALQPGVYEILFYIGDYFRAQNGREENALTPGASLPEPPFLDTVVIRIGLADAQSHYHVPLLVSPWSYSTYRGS